MRLILFSIFALAFSATAAEAKYSFCNMTSYVLSASIGYVDGDRLATRGWWRLRPGQCKVVLTEQANPGPYYVYAEAISGHKGPLRTWSGEIGLCVENAGFFNIRNQDVCRDEPLKKRNFYEVQVTEAANGVWQSDFTEANIYNVYSAEVAGVQRLLSDTGNDSIRIDGAMGRATQRALNAYRQEKGLAEGSGIDDALIDALIDDANAREAKLGLFYCNKTDNAVWSAVAEPQDAGDTAESYASRGWWKLDPGDCAKIIKGELEHDHYYVYGAIEEGMGERGLIGGDKAFCVNPAMFEAGAELTCADQDLDEAMFRRVEIGGAPSATFDFMPDMFASPVTQ